MPTAEAIWPCPVPEEIWEEFWPQNSCCYNFSAGSKLSPLHHVGSALWLVHTEKQNHDPTCSLPCLGCLAPLSVQISISSCTLGSAGIASVRIPSCSVEVSVCVFICTPFPFHTDKASGHSLACIVCKCLAIFY